MVTLWASTSLSLLPALQGFQFRSTPCTTDRSTRMRFRDAVSKPLSPQYRGIENARSTKTTPTRLNMVENTKDPEALLQIIEDLSMMEEFTPQTMAQMEKVEIALANFLEEKSAALLEQEQEQQLYDESKPPPPSIPPPGALLDTDGATMLPQQQQRWDQQQELATTLAQAGQALEELRERLREEEEALLEAEEALKQSLDEQDVLLRADEALRKSREAAELRKQQAGQRSLEAAKLSAGYREPQGLGFHGSPNETADGGDDDDDNDATTKATTTSTGGALPKRKKRPTMELGNLFGRRRATVEEESSGIVPNDDDNACSEAPEGVPVLCDWVQNEDGSITGSVRRSMDFDDGAKISTSCVPEEAVGGTTVTTESGSR